MLKIITCFLRVCSKKSASYLPQNTQQRSNKPRTLQSTMIVVCGVRSLFERSVALPVLLTIRDEMFFEKNFVMVARDFCVQKFRDD